MEDHFYAATLVVKQQLLCHHVTLSNFYLEVGWDRGKLQCLELRRRAIMLSSDSKGRLMLGRTREGHHCDILLSLKVEWKLQVQKAWEGASKTRATIKSVVIPKKKWQILIYLGNGQKASLKCFIREWWILIAEEGPYGMFLTYIIIY